MRRLVAAWPKYASLKFLSDRSTTVLGRVRRTQAAAPIIPAQGGMSLAMEAVPYGVVYSMRTKIFFINRTRITSTSNPAAALPSKGQYTTLGTFCY